MTFGISGLSPFKRSLPQDVSIVPDEPVTLAPSAGRGADEQYLRLYALNRGSLLMRSTT